jgi:hypothetical protein
VTIIECEGKKRRESFVTCYMWWYKKESASCIDHWGGEKNGKQWSMRLYGSDVIKYALVNILYNSKEKYCLVPSCVASYHIKWILRCLIFSEKASLLVSFDQYQYCKLFDTIGD